MSVACAGCGALGTGPGAVRLDLDIKATPPEHVCVKCKRKPKCKRCGKRANRVDIDGACCACLRAQERRLKSRWIRACVACAAKHDLGQMNEHGECPSCSTARMYREHPITRSAS